MNNDNDFESFTPKFCNFDSAQSNGETVIYKILKNATIEIIFPDELQSEVKGEC